MGTDRAKHRTRRAGRYWGAVMAVAALFGSAGIASAQEAEAAAEAPVYALELNRLVSGNGACRLVFVARNGLGAPIERIAFEFVLFDTDGAVERISAFDFGAMPDDKTVVRQYELPDTDCDTLGRILINDVTVCDGAGLSPESCLAALQATTRIDRAFGI